jgi:hypothetical protein
MALKDLVISHYVLNASLQLAMHADVSISTKINVITSYPLR